MSMTTTTRSYIGKGKVYAGLKAGGKMRPIGNVSALSLAISEEKKELPDYTSAGGGVKDTLTRVATMEGTMTCHDFSPENLALVTRGEVDTEASDTVSAEAHTAYQGGFVPFAHLPDATQTVTPVIAVSTGWVANTAYALGDCILESSDVYQCTVAGTSHASTEPTWASYAATGDTVTDGTVTWTNRGAVTMSAAAGGDYTLGKSGIEISNSAARFAIGLPITVAYTKADAEITQVLVASSEEYTLVFDGLNEVDSGNPMAIRMHRIKFGITSGLDMIGDEFGNLEVKFDVLQDTTITGTGVSQYMKIAQVAG